MTAYTGHTRTTLGQLYAALSRPGCDTAWISCDKFQRILERYQNSDSLLVNFESYR